MSEGWLPPSALAAIRGQETSAFRVRQTIAFWIDCFGEDFLISFKNEADLPEAQPELLEWAASQNLPVRRIYAKSIVQHPGEADKPRLLHGDATLPSSVTVTECGLRFGVDFEAGYSVGLFVDQRNNRRLLSGWKPRKLLNCFAYTCSFSVAAAALGASTLSIDLSKRALERGRNNLGLNEIPTDGHRFLADDVLKVLPRLAKRGDFFDTIILDPPTFSRSRESGVFRVEKEFPRLLGLALACAEERCTVLLSTNCSTIDRPELEAMASALCRDEGWAFRFEHAPAQEDIPPEAAPSTTWLHLTRHA